MDRRQIVAFRWRTHQLDRAAGSAHDADLLDFGVQDTGTGGAGWALANRGVDAAADLLFAWTLRGAPHAYRRADAAAVTVATAPLSEADAGKRIFDAYKPLKAAGTTALESLAAIARHERAIVTGPTVKGELSTRLTPLLDPAQVRPCRPCMTTHSWEQPFRLAALQAGLELAAGTSPPVLRRIAGLRPRPYAVLGDRAEPRFDVVRNYLRFFGPARMRDAAVYLDVPLADVKAHWPSDAVEVEVTDLPGGGRYALAGDLPALAAEQEPDGTVRLAGPYDAYLQLRDRETLVGDEAHRKDLWRMLGRPGAVLVDGEVAGTWRPKASGGKLHVTVDPWYPADPPLTAAITAEAERFATFRNLTLTDLTGA